MAKFEHGLGTIIDPGGDKPFAEVPTTQCVHCVGEDTRICTDVGVLDIGEISPNTSVLGHDGEFSPIRRIFTRQIDSYIIIKTRGGGEPIRASKEHPFLILRASYDGDYHGHDRGDFRIESDPTYLKAGEILPGMWVATKTVVGEQQIEEFCGIPFDVSMARLIGLFLAEGYVGRDTVSFAFHRDERGYIQWVIGYIKKMWGIRCHEQIRKKSKCTVLRFNSCKLERAFLGFQKYAWGKQMPVGYLKMPLDQQAALLGGLFDGDGSESCKRRRKTLCTTSPHLAYQTSLILMRLGFNPSVKSENPTIDRYGVSHRRAYRCAYSYDKGARTCRRHFDYAGYRWVRVIGAERVDDPLHVYNLSVRKSNTFLANGIVTHNCGGHFPTPSFGTDKAARKNRIGRGFCMNCNGYICGEKCIVCKPLERWLEEMEGTKDPTAVSIAVPNSSLWLPPG